MANVVELHSVWGVITKLIKVVDGIDPREAIASLTYVAACVIAEAFPVATEPEREARKAYMKELMRTMMATIEDLEKEKKIS